MACSDMCLTLPNLDPIGSELESVASIDEEDSPRSFSLLPRPSPTDFVNLFQDRNSKPYARKNKAGHVPRPRNAFILFRCDFVKQRVPDDVISDHRDLSRLAGCIWRKMSDVQKRPWFEKAEMEKRYHSEAFPEYRYTPVPGDRPKRVYRRRKPPIPEEIILLKDPHIPAMWGTTNDPPMLSPSTASPKLTTKPTPVMNTDDDPTPPRQCFRQSHVRYQSENPPLSPELDIIDGCERPSLTPPSLFCGGFVNVPRGGSNVSSWEYTPPDSGSCHQSDYWQVSTPSQYSNTTYPEPPSSDSSSLQCADTLYDMWKELGQFHDQSLQQSPQQPGNHELSTQYAGEPEYLGSQYVPCFVPNSPLGTDGLYIGGAMAINHHYPASQSP